MSTLNAHVHPVMAGILNSFVTPPTVLPSKEDYIRALQRFDWSFEFSDDGDYVRDTRAKFAELHKMQQLHDPDGSIWRTHQPAAHGVPGPIVKRQPT